MAADILIVDDERDIRELIGGILEDEGYEARLAGDSDSALAAIAERRPSMVVLDIWLQGSRLDGLDLLIEIKQAHADLPVVIISGHGNIETAVSAIKRGAYEYIEKPFKADKLVHVVGRALETSRLKRENQQLRSLSGESSELIGSSNAMKQLVQALKRAAPSNGRVMLTGPMGSGKELAARSLHTWSLRAEAPFVVLPAATMLPERMEEELFGIEDSSGRPMRVGKLEEAHGGTLYLDEVADMPVETQSKVLRVLLDQTFTRVGGAKPVKVDVRIVSSTARDLTALVKAETFREDLLHRLAVVPIKLPSLHERREDIPDLVKHFASIYSSQSGHPPRQFADDALAAIQTMDWSGNVRQLKNSVERLLIMTGGEADQPIRAANLPADLTGAGDGGGGMGLEALMSLPLREAREQFECDYLRAQLSRFGGNISRTASFVGMERSALHRKLRALDISIGDRDEPVVASEAAAG
ncbi:MAG: sigma-54 dependent transcriptional regulator [Anderseniella sp.]|jgi:two-component system nitrogen regulation response regulator NtrX|nr:sigma-54 dependent transcriptional regulator [Anderseniella sp.]